MVLRLLYCLFEGDLEFYKQEAISFFETTTFYTFYTEFYLNGNELIRFTLIAAAFNETHRVLSCSLETPFPNWG